MSHYKLLSWLDVSWHLCHFVNLACSVLFGFSQNCAYLVTLGWRQGVGGLIATRRTVYSHTEQAMRLPIDKTGAGATNRRQRASFLTLNIHTSTTSTLTSTTASSMISISKLTVTSINLATAQLRAVNRSSVLILTGSRNSQLLNLSEAGVTEIHTIIDWRFCRSWSSPEHISLFKDMLTSPFEEVFQPLEAWQLSRNETFQL